MDLNNRIRTAAFGMFTTEYTCLEMYSQGVRASLQCELTDGSWSVCWF